MTLQNRDSLTCDSQGHQKMLSAQKLYIQLEFCGQRTVLKVRMPRTYCSINAIGWHFLHSFLYGLWLHIKFQMPTGPLKQRDGPNDRTQYTCAAVRPQKFSFREFGILPLKLRQMAILSEFLVQEQCRHQMVPFGIIS